MNKLTLFAIISKEIIFLVSHVTDKKKNKELLMYRQDRQCTYKLNNEARSCNQCCSERTI